MLALLKKLLDYISSLLGKTIAQSKADEIATINNQKAADDVDHVQAQPDDAQPVIAQRLRDGTF